MATQQARASWYSDCHRQPRDPVLCSLLLGAWTPPVGLRSTSRRMNTLSAGGTSGRGPDAGEGAPHPPSNAPVSLPMFRVRG